MARGVISAAKRHAADLALVAGGRRVGSRSLRTQLTCVITALIVGAMTGCLAILWNVWSTHKDAVSASLRQTATVLALAVDKQIESSLHVARTLAGSQSVHPWNFAAFQESARDALRDEPGAWIALYDGSGRRLLHTSLRYGQDIGQPLEDENDHPPVATDQLPSGSTSSIKAALESGQVSYSGLFFARQLQAPALAVNVPVTAASGERYVVSHGIPALQFQELLVRAGLPPGWSASIVDYSGFIVARSSDPETFVGRRGSAALVAGLENRLSFLESSAMTALGHSAVAPLASVVWTPSAYYFRTFRASGGLWIAAAMLFIGLGVFASVRIADRIARGLARLEPADSERPQVPCGIIELDRVAEALRRYAVSERARRAEATRGLDEEARRKEAERIAHNKDMLLAAVSHELRNPLATIRNVAYILGTRERPPEELRLVAMLNRQTDFLQRLVDDLLDTANAAFGKLRLTLAPQNLGVVAEQARRAALAASEHPPEHCVLSAGEVWVNGDHARLVQVLRNVICNALKFSPRDGNIDIAVYERDGEAVVEVSDSGAGFDAALLPDVFESFVQGNQTAARPMGGLGLGLALVKQIVELHGGRVAAANNTSRSGATVRVVFPALEIGLDAPSRWAA